MKPSADIHDLLAIMTRLRTPGIGCPWDLEQSFATIAPYTIEEAYEVADAIERGDLDDLRDELGDLLLQVVFHARMAEEARAFDFGDVVEAITTKMIRRHPHVFAGSDADGPAAVKERWEAIKADEKAERRARRNAAGNGPEWAGILADVPAGLPALSRAAKLQKRAATVGFDWNDPKAVLAKIREELDEFEEQIGAGPVDRAKAEAELGDILFAAANLGRHLHIDQEAALRRSNQKFLRRFAFIEAELSRRGSSPAAASLDEMEDLWTISKKAETAG